MDYKEIEKIEKEREDFNKLYLSLEKWFETSLERTYWTDEDRAAFDPIKNGLAETYNKYLFSCLRRIAAIKVQKPATYVSLEDQ